MTIFTDPLTLQTLLVSVTLLAALFAWLAWDAQRMLRKVQQREDRLMADMLAHMKQQNAIRGLAVLLAVTLAACTPPQSSSAGAAQASVLAVSSPMAPTAVDPAPNPTPAPPSPPIAANPPVVAPPSCVPYNPASIVYTPNIRQVEIPANCDTGEMQAENVYTSGPDNGKAWGVGKASMVPNQRTFITLSGAPNCGTSWQRDVKRNGQFSGAEGRIYVEPSCPIPPPPPVCIVQPAGPCGEWITASNTQPNVCQPVRQQRSCPMTCGAPAVTEYRTLACPTF